MTEPASSHDAAAPGTAGAATTPDPTSLEQSGTAATTAASNGTGTKRKRGGAGPGSSTSSRGVANLTPEQLERKRANDREAQRAIRERTKQQIERLNERIRELESSQPYRDLQAVISQKDAIQAENDEIKRQLANFISVFQRYLGSSRSLEELAAVAERNPLPYPPAEQTQLLSQQDTYSSHAPAPADHASPLGGVPSVGSPASQTSIPRSYPYNTIAQPSSQTRSWMAATPNPPFERHSQTVHPDLAYGQNDERLGVDFLLDSSDQRMGKSINGVSPSPQTPGGGDQQLRHYNMIPKRVPATCPLDAILLDAVAERHRALNNGIPREEVAGPTYPNWNHLLNKNTTTPVHPISKLITDILRTFPDLNRLPEQVAVIYIMFLIARWEADPTKENYELLPEWVRPLPCQLFTPHPCWLDYLPWPRLRDAAVQTTPFTSFDTFFVPYTTTLSLNWPYAPSDVLLPTSAGPPHPLTSSSSVINMTSPGSASSPGAGSDAGPEPIWKMNPAFETHLRDLRNWSLGPLFRDTFPEWAECVRIKDDSEGGLRRTR
ncbi:uncharacterized protein PV09_04983 [Verruconis gallopava]|uniref:BZIP domain-containing protein n=1 Tax=Verruconis gallopava TaxID=253628 RepID=A0A0D1XME2_9PEZI|nr:uncharacterized protein PV09_04983 [Verruconis gallopava]KIW03661.1 hypothetical protein PV09_04983 [Verruconis gallopava]